ncbi:2-oxo acid dehydrogenase subunit E2 [Mesorhizobium sp. M0674]|uniref:2-oxo acid dehydrogenase subunit E2 n=1 Tax=unclassified Mesorhizobium TaxID=325217 RepID=UPI00333DA206
MNAPQSASLAVGSAAPRVVAGRRGRTRVTTMLTCTLSVDHRGRWSRSKQIPAGLAGGHLDPDRWNELEPLHLRSGNAGRLIE